MAVGYGSAGTIGTSTGNPVAAAPAGVVAGNYLLIIVGTKPTGTCTAPGDWTKLGEWFGGRPEGTGIDVGQVRITVFGKEATGAQGSVTITDDGTNSVSWAQMLRFTKGSGTWEAAAVAANAWGTPNTSDASGDGLWEGTSAPDGVTDGTISVAAGDYIVAAGVTPTDIGGGAAFSNYALMMTGATISLGTEVSEPFSSSGQDIGGFICYAPVTSGGAVDVITINASVSGTTTNQVGPTAFVRLREVAPPVQVTGLTASTTQENKVALAWTAQSGASFNVYRDSVQVATGVPTNSYDDFTVPVGTSASYQVEATNSVGTGAKSTAASGTALPGVPQNLVVTAGSAGRMDLTWTLNPNNSVQYRIYRDGVQVATTVMSPSLGQYSDSSTAILPDVSYDYTISSTGGAFESAQTPVVTAVGSSGISLMPNGELTTAAYKGGLPVTPTPNITDWWNLLRDPGAVDDNASRVVIAANNTTVTTKFTVTLDDTAYGFASTPGQLRLGYWIDNNTSVGYGTAEVLVDNGGTPTLVASSGVLPTVDSDPFNTMWVYTFNFNQTQWDTLKANPNGIVVRLTVQFTSFLSIAFYVHSIQLTGQAQPPPVALPATQFDGVATLTIDGTVVPKTDTPLGPLDMQGTGTQTVDATSESGAAITLIADGSSLDLAGFIGLHFGQVEMAGGSELALRVPTPRTADPSSGREPYRLVITDHTGYRYAELEHAHINNVAWLLNDYGTLDFDLPSDDAKITELQVPIREVQVWKGTQIKWWGVLVKARGDAKTVNFQAVSLEWYFSRRVVGRVPKTELVVNGGFEQGEQSWNFGYEIGSIPKAPPQHSIALDRSLSGGQALRMSGSDAVETTVTESVQTLSGDVAFDFDSATLTGPGLAAVDAFAAGIPDGAMVTLVGHTDSTGSESYNQTLSENRANAVRDRMNLVRPGLNITAYGRGESQPIATNSTPEGQALNRRVDMSYTLTVQTVQTATGHKQYAYQTIYYTNPVSNKKAVTVTLVGWVYIEDFIGPAADGWGIYLEWFKPDGPWDFGISQGYSYVSLNADTPRDRWVRMECSLTIPADGVAYLIMWRAYPPAGTAVFDEISVTFTEQLGYFDIDQALIVKALVEHAQDPAMGKSDLNIGTNTPLTGVLRTREYPFIDRQQVSEALSEFPTLADGVETEVVVTPDTRTYTTYYPRKGRVKDITLALGVNIASFDVDVDGEQTSSQIIVQAEGEGSDREEGYAENRDLLEGIVLEKVYNATPGSAVSSLTAQARRGLGRYRKPVVIPSITSKPGLTNELLDQVVTGDIVTVDIRRGWMQALGLYRIVGIGLDPNTDQITFTITPWDEWSV